MNRQTPFSRLARIEGSATYMPALRVLTEDERRSHPPKPINKIAKPQAMDAVWESFSGPERR